MDEFLDQTENVEVYGDSLTPEQERSAGSVIEQVKKQLGARLINTRVLGFDPRQMIEAIKQTRKDKSQEVRQVASTEMKQLKKARNIRFKIIFELDEKSPALSVVADYEEYPLINMYNRKTKTLGVIRYIWTGVLENRIPLKVIFGRAYTSPDPKSEAYCFAPFAVSLENARSLHESYLVERMRQPRVALQVRRLGKINTVIDNLARPVLRIFTELRKVEGQSFGRVAESCFRNSVIAGLDLLRRGPLPASQLWTACRLNEAGRSLGSPFLNPLVENNVLMSSMKRLLHYGKLRVDLYLATSNADVSAICVPVSNTTVFQLVDYGRNTEVCLNAVKELASALDTMDGGVAEDWEDVEWLKVCESERKKYLTEQVLDFLPHL